MYRGPLLGLIGEVQVGHGDGLQRSRGGRGSRGLSYLDLPVVEWGHNRGVDVSIVVPSFQGEQRLPGLMQALSEQRTGYEWEVVVVLDGSTDQSANVLQKWSSKLPLRIIRRGENKGRSRTLNDGFEAAHGEVLVRCDDDLLPGANHVQGFGETILSAPTSGVIGLCRNQFPDTTYARVYGAHVDQRFRQEAYSTDPEVRWKYWGGNCGVHRRAWESVGGYDEDFREYGWEDIDWGYRLVRSGFAITINPELETIHRIAATTLDQRLKRARLSGAASVKFYQKHDLPPPIVLSGTWGAATRVASMVVSGRRSGALGALLLSLPQRWARVSVDLAVQAAFYRGYRTAAWRGPYLPGTGTKTPVQPLLCRNWSNGPKGR